jgi:TRAP-type C4-dicarboxylate transport system permease large subunit
VRLLVAGVVWLILFYILTSWFARKRAVGTLTRASFALTYAVFVGAIPMWLISVGGVDLSLFTVLLASAILGVSTFLGAYYLSPILLRLR